MEIRSRLTWGALLAGVAIAGGACSKDGATGPQGSQGATGAMGAPGAMGAKGDKGDMGQMGLPGTNGTDGTTGPMGERGPSGPAIVISDLAQYGLELSAAAGAPVNTSSLTQAQLEQVGRGAYLTNAIGGCNDCHQAFGPAGPEFLAGGTPFPVPGPGNQLVYARNLTPDMATGLRLTEQEFIDSLRTGIDHKVMGTTLQVMPWPVYRWMSTADLKAIYAYLLVIPAVANDAMAMPDVKNQSMPLPFTGVYDTGDSPPTPLPPEDAPDPDYVLRGLAIQPLAPPSGFDTWATDQQALFGRGSYLVNAVAGCNDCHTNPPYNFASSTPFRINTDVYLTGGTVFRVPPPLQPRLHQKRTMSENLIGQNHGFNVSFPVFLATLTQGVHADDPDPTPLGWPMPWMSFRHMTRQDIEAVYTYVRNLTRATGSRDKITAELARACAMTMECGTGERCQQGECLKDTCLSAADCSVCQTCGTSTVTMSQSCNPPASDSPCLTNGI
jgi:collagen triple helix repeat protein